MKISELRGVLEDKKADFALFYNLDTEKTNANISYLSGYNGIGALIIPKKQGPFLVVPKMEYLRAKKSMIKKVVSMDKKRFIESIYSIAKKKWN